MSPLCPHCPLMYVMSPSCVSVTGVFVFSVFFLPRWSGLVWLFWSFRLRATVIDYYKGEWFKISLIISFPPHFWFQYFICRTSTWPNCIYNFIISLAKLNLTNLLWFSADVILSPIFKFNISFTKLPPDQLILRIFFPSSPPYFQAYFGHIKGISSLNKLWYIATCSFNKSNG